MDDKEKLKRIAELIEDYVDLDTNYGTVKDNLSSESFLEVASDMTDVLLTFKKIKAVLDAVH